MKTHTSFFRAVGYECRKMFFTPLMLVFAGLLLIFNCWKLTDTYLRADPYRPFENSYSLFYNSYLGTLNQDKLDHITGIYTPLHQQMEAGNLSRDPSPDAYTDSPYGDYFFFKDRFYTLMTYCRDYALKAETAGEAAENLAALYEARGNSPDAAMNRRIAAAFQGRELPCFYETFSWDTLIRYDYSSLMVLLLTIFALSGSFVTERETGMDMLLKTTRNGTAVTVWAKLLASVIFVFGACLLFYGCDFITVSILSGRPQALTQPVYILAPYTPLTMKLGQYILWSALVKALGLMVCGCLVMLISSVTRQSLTAFFVSFVVMVACILLFDFREYCGIFSLLNPVQLIMLSHLTESIHTVSLLGVPMYLHEGAMLCCGLVLLLLLAGILYESRSYHHRRRKERRPC